MFTVNEDTREVTVTEAGALVGKSSEAIRRAVRRGEIKVLRWLGPNMLLDRAEVERWAAARPRRGEAPKPGE